MVGEAVQIGRDDSYTKDALQMTLTPLIRRASSFLPPPQTNAPVGGCLQQHLPVWNLLQAPPTIQSIIKDGYALPFRKKPPTTLEPISMLGGNLEEIRKQVIKLAEKRAIETVQHPIGEGFYSRLFLVPKSSGGYRPVIDLSKITKYIQVPRFKMETAASIRDTLQGSHWAITVDLTDAYFHIPMHAKAKPFLRFMIDETVWQFRALPFGLASAPFLFTWIVRPLVRTLRSAGVRIHTYLDDWIVYHPNRQTLEKHTQWVLQMAALMGFKVNREKSNLTPTQNLIYLGMEFNLKDQTVFPPEKKCQEIKELAEILLTQPKKSTASNWAKLLGKLAFIAPIVPQGRLHTRPLQMHLSKHWNYNWKKRNQYIPAEQEIVPALKWWMHKPTLQSGTSLQTVNYSHLLMTDASREGWGAHLGNKKARGEWTPQHEDLHINKLEMLAIFHAVKAFKEDIKGRTIMIATDNATVLSYLKKQGGTKSYSLTQQDRARLDYAGRGRTIQ